MSIQGTSSKPAIRPKQQDQEAGPGQVLVKPGDTLSKLAKEHGVSVGDFMAANPQIKDANKILAGAVFNIPQAKPAAAPAASAEPAVQSPRPDAATRAGAKAVFANSVGAAQLQNNLAAKLPGKPMDATQLGQKFPNLSDTMKDQLAQLGRDQGPEAQARALNFMNGGGAAAGNGALGVADLNRQYPNLSDTMKQQLSELGQAQGPEAQARALRFMNGGGTSSGNGALGVADLNRQYPNLSDTMKDQLAQLGRDQGPEAQARALNFMNGGAAAGNGALGEAELNRRYPNLSDTMKQQLAQLGRDQGPEAQARMLKNF